MAQMQLDPGTPSARSMVGLNGGAAAHSRSSPDSRQGRLKPWHQASAPHFRLECRRQGARVDDEAIDLDQPRVGVVLQHLAPTQLGRVRVEMEAAADRLASLAMVDFATPVILARSSPRRCGL